MHGAIVHRDFLLLCSRVEINQRANLIVILNLLLGDNGFVGWTIFLHIHKGYYKFSNQQIRSAISYAWVCQCVGLGWGVLVVILAHNQIIKLCGILRISDSLTIFFPCRHIVACYALYGIVLISIEIA